ncbi:MAG: hypothetical protein EHM61_14475 [Acidobacteria bacterium]|nr:MAG: hypothetical protein EHM61_14475 [Acidobacteriota bacterium]
MNEVCKVAQLGEKDRRDLFGATAQAMEIHEAIIEKDFWECWVLDFGDSQWKAIHDGQDTTEPARENGSSRFAL